MHVAAVIVAGGQGARMGTPQPKQLLEIDGRSLLQLSVAVCDSHPDVSELVVVLPEGLTSAASELIGPTRRPCHAVAGGPRRQDSVRHGVFAVSSDADIVLVHDAARPFASVALIDRVIAAAMASGAAIPAIGARDTVKRRDAESGLVRESVPRAEIWMAQTPQGFRRDVLDLIQPLSAGDREATDESMLVEWAGRPVMIVE